MFGAASSSDLSVAAAAFLVAVASGLCLRSILTNARPTPLGKIGTRWERHRGLMWVEIVLLTIVLLSSTCAGLWFAFRDS